MEFKHTRHYELKVETEDANVITDANGNTRLVGTSINHITITPPITLKFEVERNNLASANTANFKIYNLNAATRNGLMRDPMDMISLRNVNFNAGYRQGTERLMATLFEGNVKSGLSSRQGTEWVTELDCFFGTQLGQVSLTEGPGITKKNLIEKIAGTMPGVKDVVVGNKGLDMLKRAVSVFGNSFQMVKELMANGVTIDNGVLQVLSDDEVIYGDIQLVKASSGLLGVPKRSKNFIEFDMMFEPRIKINQFLKLENDILSSAITSKERLLNNFDGEYKVVGLTHRGTISDAVCEDAITTVSLWYLPNFTRVKS
jgi:hypothetical protein